MENLGVTDRLTFLAKKFDVFNCDTDNLKIKVDELKVEGYLSTTIIKTNKNITLGLFSRKNIDEIRTPKISICLDVFASIIEADPTDNKMYVQWMLQLFVRLLKTDENIDQAVRFVTEDLPQANIYLTLFEGNKRKKKFKDLSINNFILKDITDVTDINQYRSLAQLFDAVDPFIEKEASAIEGLLEKFVNSGQGIIPVKDRKFTVFIPKTRDANTIFDKYANWCTAKPDNGMFKNYTENYKKPNGKNSDIYIIINNKFFQNESNEIYQIHFETSQVKDRKNGSNINIFENVINESIGLSNFFYSELMAMAKSNNKGLDDNKYLDHLIKFGFADSLFEFINEDTPVIKFMKREIPRLPDLSKFKNLDQLIITDANLVDIHPSIGALKSLEMLCFNGNKIKKIPKEIGNLKGLYFMNLIGNPISEIPDEIKYLDKSNGGSLHRLGIFKDDIGEDNYLKLKRLLPSVEIS